MACSIPEEELILLCARTSVNEKDAERIKELLRSGVDWNSIIRTAAWHKVMPLLYRSLNSVSPESVPEAALDQLHKHYLSNLGRNIFLTKQLLKIVDLLNANGIPTILFKGLALASSVYGDLGLRQFNDLDLLIRKKDALRALDLLRIHQFHPAFPLTREQEKILLHCNYHYEFRRNDEKVFVEIHWGLTPFFCPFAFDVDRLWKASRPILLQGKTVQTLAPEDSLLTLCEHGAKHRWGRLSWICDVAELINTCKQINWPEVLQKAEALGGRRMLSLGLRLARELFRTRLPEYIIEWIHSDRLIKSLVKQVRNQILHVKGAQTGDPEDRIFLFYLKTMLRPQDRIKSCLNKIILPLPDDLALLPQSTFWFPLIYLIRPIRLIAKYERILINRYFSKEVGTPEHAKYPLRSLLTPADSGQT